MKHKPEYEITKTRFDVEREKIKERLDSECPECGYTVKITKRLINKYPGRLPVCICGAHMAVDLEDQLDSE